MNVSKWTKLLVLASFLSVCACSNDGGDGKDDKGDKTSDQVAPASGVVSEKSCLKNDELRQQCYQEILKMDSQAINELGGANPFMIQVWDHLDLSSNPYADQILSCREKYPKLCQ